MPMTTDQSPEEDQHTTTTALEATCTQTPPPTPQPVWDPIQQIYIGGVVPDTDNAVQALIQANGGALRLFGYGSLCWKPGGILEHITVTQHTGQAVGYRRCWCQKSTDHRGWPRFPGIVCTLLQDAEVQQLLKSLSSSSSTPSLTEGVVYTVPPALTQACLEELDFREKGGYAREVIDVVLDNNDNDSNEPRTVVTAALYRGTVDNPALWPRVLRDPVFAAAVLSVAVGPSGPNTEYLHNLHHFLQQHAHAATKKSNKNDNDDDDTFRLTQLVDQLQKHYTCFFLHGCGSNQHNQLLLQHYRNYLVRGEEVHDLTEILLATRVNTVHTKNDPPAAVYAGGGHSAVRTTTGRVFLFGWNEAGQCGDYTTATAADEENGNTIPQAWPCPLIAQHCALGFAHTLLLVADPSSSTSAATTTPGTVYAMGDNAKGQVTGDCGDTTSIRQPVVPTPLQGHENDILTMAAGLFHSAAITRQGQVIQWGGGSGKATLTWTPPTSLAVGVACGRKFTVVWCHDGTLWSWGSDNKYGQLGRTMTTNDTDSQFGVISTPWSSLEYKIVQVDVGWSHAVVLLEHVDTGERTLYGWGRNDKGQLGLGHNNTVIPMPTRLSLATPVAFVSCGSEFTVAVSSTPSLQGSYLWGCGWNEHGNLGESGIEYTTEWKSLAGQIVFPPGTRQDADADAFPIAIAAGGSHVLATRVQRQ